MTETFAPAAVHETLDREGLLDDAHGPGCYAIQMRVPDSPEAASRRWLEHYDALPGDEALERLAAAPRTCYVGASSDVYGRLMDHAEAEVRKASVFRAFPPEGLVYVWTDENPFDAEWGRALALREEGWTCWVNGEVVG